MLGGRFGRVDEGSGDDRDRFGAMDALETFFRQVLGGSLAGRQLRRQHLGRHGVGPAPIPGPADLCGRVEDHGMAGNPEPAGHSQVDGSAAGIQPQGVDDREQAPRQTPFDHQIEDDKGVSARALVVLARPDHGPHGIGRHDLVGREVRRRPMGLSGAGRSDQNDQAWRGHTHRHSLAP